MPPTPWASGTSPPRTRPTWPPPATAGPWPGASTAGTGSTGARPTSSSRPSTTTITRSSRRGRSSRGLPPERRPGRPGHRPDWPTCGPWTPTAGSSSTSPPGPATRPTTPRLTWIERYRGRFDKGWDRWRDEIFARQLELGTLGPGHRDGPRPALGAGVGRPAARDQTAGGGPVHGVLRRLPVLHRRPAGPGAGVPRADRRPATTPWSSWSRTTGPARRVAWTGRSTTTGWRTSTRPARPSCERRIDELGGPSAHNNYPWGWTMAGNTPFKRWKREVHEGGVADPCIVSWPAGLRSVAGCGASSPTPSTSSPPCWSWPASRPRRPSSTCPRPSSTG